MNLSGSTDESLFVFIKGLNSKVSSETFLGVNKGQKRHEKTYLYHINVTCVFMIFVPRVHVTLTLPIAMPLETLISQQIILFFSKYVKMKRKQQKTENLSCLFRLFDYNRNKTNKKDAYTKKVVGALQVFLFN